MRVNASVFGASSISICVITSTKPARNAICPIEIARIRYMPRNVDSGHQRNAQRGLAGVERVKQQRKGDRQRRREGASDCDHQRSGCFASAQQKHDVRGIRRQRNLKDHPNDDDDRAAHCDARDRGEPPRARCEFRSQELDQRRARAQRIASRGGIVFHQHRCGGPDPHRIGGWIVEQHANRKTLRDDHPAQRALDAG